MDTVRVTTTKNSKSNSNNRIMSNILLARSIIGANIIMFSSAHGHDHKEHKEHKEHDHGHVHGEECKHDDHKEHKEHSGHDHGHAHGEACKHESHVSFIIIYCQVWGEFLIFAFPLLTLSFCRITSTSTKTNPSTTTIISTSTNTNLRTIMIMAVTTIMTMGTSTIMTTRRRMIFRPGRRRPSSRGRATQWLLHLAGLGTPRPLSMLRMIK